MLTFEIGKKPFHSICDNNQVPFHSLIDFSWTKMTAENFSATARNTVNYKRMMGKENTYIYAINTYKIN